MRPIFCLFGMLSLSWASDLPSQGLWCNAFGIHSPIGTDYYPQFMHLTAKNTSSNQRRLELSVGILNLGKFLEESNHTLTNLQYDIDHPDSINTSYDDGVAESTGRLKICKDPMNLNITGCDTEDQRGKWYVEVSNQSSSHPQPDFVTALERGLVLNEYYTKDENYAAELLYRVHCMRSCTMCILYSAIYSSDGSRPDIHINAHQAATPQQEAKEEMGIFGVVLYPVFFGISLALFLCMVLFIGYQRSNHMPVNTQFELPVRLRLLPWSLTMMVSLFSWIYFGGLSLLLKFATGNGLEPLFRTSRVWSCGISYIIEASSIWLVGLAREASLRTISDHELEMVNLLTEERTTERELQARLEELRLRRTEVQKRYYTNPHGRDVEATAQLKKDHDDAIQNYERQRNEYDQVRIKFNVSRERGDNNRLRATEEREELDNQLREYDRKREEYDRLLELYKDRRNNIDAAERDNVRNYPDDPMIATTIDVAVADTGAANDRWWNKAWRSLRSLLRFCTTFAGGAPFVIIIGTFFLINSSSEPTSPLTTFFYSLFGEDLWFSIPALATMLTIRSMLKTFPKVNEPHSFIHINVMLKKLNMFFYLSVGSIFVVACLEALSQALLVHQRAEMMKAFNESTTALSNAHRAWLTFCRHGVSQTCLPSLRMVMIISVLCIFKGWRDFRARGQHFCFFKDLYRECRD